MQKLPSEGFLKNVLFETSQNSQKNICVRISFSDKIQLEERQVSQSQAL